MIEIKVDKESEILWLKSVIGAGTCNLPDPYTLMYLGVDLKHDMNIRFKPSDIYEDDVKEKIAEYNRRFPDNNISKMQAERILREELLGKRGKYNDSIQTT